jgi:hypothetical protein
MKKSCEGKVQNICKNKRNLSLAYSETTLQHILEKTNRVLEVFQEKSLAI